MTGKPTLQKTTELRLPYTIRDGDIHSRLTLGTVQLGMAYGAANRTGQPRGETAVGIVRTALRHGVTHLDCARAYGQAEAILGQALTPDFRKGLATPVTVITKLDPLSDLSETPGTREALQAVEASVSQSCRALKTERLDVLLLHRWAHAHALKGALWRHLLRLRSDGVIGLLGASVQTPEEALDALADPDIRSLQLPFNVLDWRWKEAGLDRALEKRPDVVVHARSALLQGILPAEAAFWPGIEGVVSDRWPHRWIEKLRQVTRDLDRQGIPDLCFAYVLAQPWITSVVVGVETCAQLTDNLALFHQPPLTKDEADTVERRLAGAPEALLNPARWSRER